MRAFIAATVVSLGLTGVSHADDVQASTKQYQIAAQPLVEALRAFASQSGPSRLTLPVAEAVAPSALP